MSLIKSAARGDMVTKHILEARDMLMNGPLASATIGDINRTTRNMKRLRSMVDRGHLPSLAGFHKAVEDAQEVTSYGLQDEFVRAVGARLKG